MELAAVAAGIYFLTRDSEERKQLLKHQRESRREEEEITNDYPVLYSAVILIVVVFLILYIVAVFYISWNCNTKGSPNMGGFEKSLRAFLAALFPNIYIILYSFFWQDKCKT